MTPNMKLYDDTIEEELARIAFAEKERDMILDTTIFSSENEIGRTHFPGGHRSYHWIPELYEVAIIDTHAVPSDDDVDFEWNLVGTMSWVSEIAFIAQASH